MKGVPVLGISVHTWTFYSNKFVLKDKIKDHGHTLVDPMREKMCRFSCGVFDVCFD